MAVRQYIGARYVPLYMGDWDNTRNYEPLSIVTDANGNSFTSMKDVPAGTPLNNRDYWVQTSSFSGAVDALGRRVSDAEEQIEGLHGDIDRVQTEINAVEAEIEEMKSNGLLVALGDSFLAATALPDSDRAVTKIAENLGMEKKNFCSNGAGFFEDATYNNVLKEFLDGWSGMSDDEKKSLKIILIGAGINDINRDATISLAQWKSRFSAVFSGIKSTLDSFDASGRLSQNVRVYVIPMLYRWHPLTYDQYSAYGVMTQALAEFSSPLALSVIPRAWQWMTGHIEYKHTDGTHFNATGQSVLCDHILSAMLGNNYMQTQRVKLSNTSVNGAYLVLDTDVVDGAVTVHGAISMLNATADVPSGTNLLDGADIPADYINVSAYAVNIVACQTRLDESSNIRLTLNATIDGGSSGKTITLTNARALKVGGYYEFSVSYQLGVGMTR